MWIVDKSEGALPCDINREAGLRYCVQERLLRNIEELSK